MRVEASRERCAAPLGTRTRLDDSSADVNPRTAIQIYGDHATYLGTLQYLYLLFQVGGFYRQMYCTLPQHRPGLVLRYMGVMLFKGPTVTLLHTHNHILYRSSESDAGSAGGGCSWPGGWWDVLLLKSAELPPLGHAAAMYRKHFPRINLSEATAGLRGGLRLQHVGLPYLPPT